MSIATNTLIVTNTNDMTLTNILQQLEINPIAVSNLKPLNRSVLSFKTTRESKEALDKLKTLLPSTSKLFYGEHFYYNDPLCTLQVPQQEKNFLLSPPGDPPIGWVQITETDPHQFDHRAIHHDFDDGFSLDNNNNNSDTNILINKLESKDVTHNSIEFNFGVDLPSIVVDELEGPGKNMPRTAMPPSVE